jgi:inner membrane protein
MDSLSQAALGAAVCVAVMQRRTPVWKAALIGAVAGTLPDLDALIDFGDPVSNMTFHRGDSHALFWLTLAAPALAGLVSRLRGEAAHFKRWWLALWLALVTHPILDTFTIYGTQIWRPFSGEPEGIGSLFIIDPAYTVPLLIGVGAAMAGRLRWNTGGLALSTLYIAWSVVAQSWVLAQARDSLRQQGQPVQQMFATPAPFTTLLWNVVAISADGLTVLQGQRGLLDAPGAMPFERFERGLPLMAELQGNWHVQRVAWFSRGFWRLTRDGDAWVIHDLRMGIAPNSVFAFRVRSPVSERHTHAPEAVGGRGDIGTAMTWLRRRVRGEPVAPPG